MGLNGHVAGCQTLRVICSGLSQTRINIQGVGVTTGYRVGVAWANSQPAYINASEMNPDCLCKCEKLDSIRAGKLLTIQASLPNLCTAVDQFREIFVDSVIDPDVSTIAISCSCCTCKPTKTNDATIAPMPASSATSFQLRGFIPIHWPHVRQDRCMSMECPLHKAAVHQPITQKFASGG